MISTCPFSISTCRRFPDKALPIFLLVLLVTAAPARASENLIFKPAESHYKSRIVAAFVETLDPNEKGPFLVAKTDLNGDDVPEYFVKSTKSSDLKNHWIIALKRRTPTFLTKIPAKKIVVSDKKTYGIRKLIVYNRPENDFRKEIFVWNPIPFRFEPEK